MFKGINDSLHHVKELARLLNGMRCRINLIGFHPIPGTPFQGSDQKTMKIFQEALNQKGLITTIRLSRGLDIAAACGLLSTNVTIKNKQAD
jgi:23S rRNA (adenine2503-C2)-methyltransferase